MVRRSGYELIDAGGERRLERFGDLVVDRPAPGAEQPPRDLVAWTRADLRFDRPTGWTTVADVEPAPWLVDDGHLRFELRPTETGQVGLFPEQASNRAWMTTAIVDARRRTVQEPVSILHLFAYTGATTLSAAAAGAHVTHVDGSRPTVAWARHNAGLSGLGDRPIRWIVDDVEGFVDREIRRGRTYEAVVLDPPTYGHGPRGRSWTLVERLPELLASCARLTGGDPAFALLTAHTPGFGPGRLAAELAESFGRRQAEVEAGELALRATSGARLQLGAYARIIRG